MVVDPNGLMMIEPEGPALHYVSHHRGEVPAAELGKLEDFDKEMPCSD